MACCSMLTCMSRIDTDVIADLSLLLLFVHFCRNLHLAHTRVQQGNYSLGGLVGIEMFKKTVGIIGELIPT